MGPGTDADVVAVSLQNPSAFGELYDRHAPSILRYLVRRVGPTAGEQLLGDTFRIGFERRASFDPAHETARPWLYGIATNLVRRHRRSEDRRVRATARLAGRRENPAGDDEQAIAATDARALLPTVADAVLTLPEAERETLLLFAWEDLSYEEIAVALEIPSGTVRSRIHRARRTLRQQLASPTRSQPSVAEVAPGGARDE
jgi:RNA polymerase sigma factor (sigma-70 family)